MPEKKNRSVQISILVPEHIVSMLREDAVKNYRSLSAEVSFICDQYFQKENSAED